MKKTQNKRSLTAALLAVAMLLSGCGIITFPTDEPPTTTAPVTTKPAPVTTKPVPVTTQDVGGNPVEKDSIAQAKAYVQSLRDADFGGDSMFIAQAEGDTGVTVDELQAATMLDVQIVQRNRLVEEKYSTHVLVRRASNRKQLIENVRVAKNSDEYYADLICTPAADLGVMQAKGLLQNLYSLPFTDYSAPYFNAESMIQTSGGYAMYGALGAMTEDPASRCVCFFNQILENRYRLTGPYKAVSEGKWTWDLLLTELEKYSGRSGLLSTDYSVADLTENLFLGAGGHYLDCGARQVPALSYAGTDEADAALMLMKKITAPESSSTLDNGTESFWLGYTYLFIAPLSSASSINKMHDKWGVAPLPTVEAGDPFYTVITGDSRVICVPQSGIDLERTGLFLQAMFAASYVHLGDAVLYDYTTAYLRDNQSILMLDQIMRLPVRDDFTRFYGTQYPSLISATRDLMERAVTSDAGVTRNYGGYLSKVKNDMQEAFPMIYSQVDPQM